MSDDREFLRATTDWLAAGSDRTPPRAIDGVLLAVRTTRQERVLPNPWRNIDMNALGKALIAATAVVAIALAWISFGPSGNSVGVSPTPSPTPTSSPTPTPIPMPPWTSNPGPSLQAGARYVTTDPFPIRLSFVAPAGWAGNVGGPNAVWAGPAWNGSDLSFQLNTTVSKDPCHPEQGAVQPSPGPRTDELVAAIIGRPGLAPTTPTSTTIGGRPATTFRLMLSAPPSSCTNGTYLLWQLPLGATNELQTGMSQRVWVLDTAAGPLVVDAVDAGDATPAQQQALQQAIDSIQFEPTTN